MKQIKSPCRACNIVELAQILKLENNMSERKLCYRKCQARRGYSGGGRSRVVREVPAER